MTSGLHPVATIARVLDCSERRVQDLARSGIIPKAKRGRYDLIGCVQAYIRHLRAVASAHKSEDGKLDLTAERARLAREQADLQALRNAELRGRLISVEEVQQTWAQLVLRAKEKLRAVPSRAHREIPGLGKRETRQLLQMIDEALTELAEP